jgi:diketogulonate reductase-like aldo/keto reductase
MAGAAGERTIRLNTGASIPRIGLGVFGVPRGEIARRAVLEALALGYRQIDTAKVYGNESDVGEALRESGVPRGEVFVTTKLWNNDQGTTTALRAFDGALERMGLDYVDLFLLHWPVPGRRLEAWRALEELFSSKRARAIGVSNFMPNHLLELLAVARVVPAVNQIELSPFFQQRDVRAVCAAHGVVVQAYSPLTKGLRLGHPVLLRVAEEARRTPAQVLIRWGIQSGFVVLPKSTRPERLAENLAVFDFELTAAQMATLEGLEAGLSTGWDPRGQP